ncbi:MAG TPA: DMT family transporter [Ktedonobacterales bacterium]|nr:DMT family transporter [Ktedonobacterales bacterium]
MTASANPAASSAAARAIRQPRLSRRGAFGLLVLANALWAGTYTAGKVALSQLSPVELNAVRFSLAALMLSPVLIRGWRQIPRDRATLIKLAQLALLGFVLNKAFEYFGLNLSTASDVALLITTESIFTALLSWTFLRERVTSSGVAALALGLLGAYLIVERGFLPNLGGSGTARVVGDLLVVVSLFLEAGYTVRGKTVLSAMPPLLFTATTLAGGLFIWLPAGAIAVAHSGWPHITLAGWLAVLYMAAVATVTGYWLWFRALTRLDASAAAPTLFIQPLLGAALAIWLLHDSLSWATLLGGALIGASLLLVVRSSRRPNAPAVAVEAP